MAQRLGLCTPLPGPRFSPQLGGRGGGPKILHGAARKGVFLVTSQHEGGWWTGAEPQRVSQGQILYRAERNEKKGALVFK